MLYEINAAVPHPDHTVTVTWTDGARGVVSLEPSLARGRLFAVGKDPDYIVRAMRIPRGGVGLTWPNEVDFSADGLRHDAFPEERFGECDESVSAKGPWDNKRCNLVIASRPRGEAIQGFRTSACVGALDCFVASAPRNDGSKPFAYSSTDPNGEDTFPKITRTGFATPPKHLSLR